VYLEHFGLKAPPFRERADDGSWIALPNRSSARLRLRYALEQGGGPALIVGPSGAGKTTEAAALTLETARRPVWLRFPALPASELPAFLADELAGLSRSGETGATPVPAHRALKRLRDGFQAAKRPVLLILDDAHLIDDSKVFEMLVTLTKLPEAQENNAALLMVGGLQTPRILPASVAERLAARTLLAPLTRPESAAYIEGRLRRAGAERTLFGPEAIDLIHQHAQGLPRRLNRIADLALVLAFAEGRDAPDERCVRSAARELEPNPIAA